MVNKIILPILFAFLLILSSCTEEITPTRKFGFYEEIPSEVAEDIEMMYSDSFQVRVIIKSPKLIRYGGSIDERREEFKGGIQVNFLGDNQTATSQLTAKEAVKKMITIVAEDGRKRKESVIIVKKDVVLKGGNGDVLTTDELTWFERSDYLSTSKHVNIQTKDKRIFGFGFKSDKEFKNWKIHSVIGEFQSDDIIPD